LTVAGWTVDDIPDRLSWRAVLAIIRHARRESAVFRLLAPPKLQWDQQTYFLADAVDILRWIQWAKSKDGEAGRNYPKPIPRPGQDQTIRGTVPGEAKFGDARMTVEEANKFLREAAGHGV